jgi:hypothetical protein
MLGQHDRSEALFYYFRLEDQVPENHLLRLIDQHISFGFVREQLKESSRATVAHSADLLFVRRHQRTQVGGRTAHASGLAVVYGSGFRRLRLPDPLKRTHFAKNLRRRSSPRSPFSGIVRLERFDVLSLPALLSFDHVEFHLLALLQAFEAARLDC